MKKIYYDKNADKELAEFSISVQKVFLSLINILKTTGKLEFPVTKKLEKNLYEIRVKLQGEFRGFYAYMGKEFIVILHFFHKKTQKTPLKNLKTAKRRLKQYE
ncbi:MAG: type II toxin-antitoxin system RelE/ParE family toxin [Candidatus Beckwithbacteria bacterium]|nr:type II toxin-antitoxin system RelE/ParE family toxin [Candidatus Beckwithbacteria bacterium]